MLAAGSPSCWSYDQQNLPGHMVVPPPKGRQLGPLSAAWFLAIRLQSNWWVSLPKTSSSKYSCRTGIMTRLCFLNVLPPITVLSYRGRSCSHSDSLIPDCPLVAGKNRSGNGSRRGQKYRKLKPSRYELHPSNPGDERGRLASRSKHNACCYLY